MQNKWIFLLERQGESVMREFGTEEYGNKDGFKIICNKCGKEARLVPAHYYKGIKNLDKITLEIRCVCGNRYGATIHKEQKRDNKIYKQKWQINKEREVIKYDKH